MPKGFEKTVLCIARISPQKNVNLFLEIARLLPQFAFVWIGNSAKITHELDNVFFLGNIPEAGCYCKFCDILILTSNYEGLPIAIIEAMRWGKPVVASNVGGISEIVENGRNGFVSENSALSFKKYIDGVLVSDKVYESMSNYSRQLYKSKLTVDEMLVNYLSIYNTVKLSS
jgi:glycosyltransferase involved in cell wall biosynthesis